MKPGITHRKEAVNGARTPGEKDLTIRVERILRDEKTRRQMQRRILLFTPPAEKKRVKALAQMAPPTTEEVARLVEQFQRDRYVTQCPARAAAPINHGEGFGE